jgi:hypothetical protein
MARKVTRYNESSNAGRQTNRFAPPWCNPGNPFCPRILWKTSPPFIRMVHRYRQTRPYAMPAEDKVVPHRRKRWSESSALSGTLRKVTRFCFEKRPMHAVLSRLLCGRPPTLLLCCVLDMIDNHYFNRDLGLFQFESELLLYGSEDGRSGVDRRIRQYSSTKSQRPVRSGPEQVSRGHPQERVCQASYGPLAESHMKSRFAAPGYAGLLVIFGFGEFGTALAYH